MTHEPTAVTPSGVNKAKMLIWPLIFIGLLLIFSVVKLPEIRLKNYVQGQMAAALATQGLTFTSTDSDFSYWLGPTYSLEGVTISGAQLSQPIRLKEIEISPSLLSLFTLRIGAKLKIDAGKGALTGTVSAKGLNPPTGLKVFFDLKQIDLNQLQVLPIAAKIQGGMIATGTLEFAGDLKDPKDASGSLNLNLSKIQIEQQSIAGFNIPKLLIDDGTINGELKGGKFNIKSFRLGKAGNASDDITLNTTGDIELKPTLASSQLNVDVTFTTSAKIQKAFMLLDALLSDGKVAEGSYAYHLTGPLDSPIRGPKK